MTQFGKRIAAGPAVSPNRPDNQQPDVGAALAAVTTGKLPAWTTMGPIKLLIGVLLFAGGLYVTTVKYAGDLVRDVRLAGSWQVAYDLQAFDGSCTRHNFVVTLCSASIRSKAEPGRAPLASQFMMLCQGEAFRKLLFGVVDSISPEEIDRTVAEAAEIFMAMYGADSPLNQPRAPD